MQTAGPTDIKSFNSWLVLSPCLLKLPWWHFLENSKVVYNISSHHLRTQKAIQRINTRLKDRRRTFLCGVVNKQVHLGFFLLFFICVKWSRISCARPNLIPRNHLTFPFKRPQIDHVFKDWVQECSALQRVMSLATLGGELLQICLFSTSGTSWFHMAVLNITCDNHTTAVQKINVVVEG